MLTDVTSVAVGYSKAIKYHNYRSSLFTQLKAQEFLFDFLYTSSPVGTSF